jgi:hypothetical protein
VTADLGGPYTSHGHAVQGVTVVGLDRPPVVRCGGPAICSTCARDANRIRIEHASRPETTDDWAEPTGCDNEHPEVQWAVAILHIIGSDSAANAVALCGGCLVSFIEEWTDEVLARDPEAYRYELRPVSPPDSYDPEESGDTGREAPVHPLSDGD